jgi:hypothetical protein
VGVEVLRKEIRSWPLERIVAKAWETTSKQFAGLPA